MAVTSSVSTVCYLKGVGLCQDCQPGLGVRMCIPLHGACCKCICGTCESKVNCDFK